MAKALKHYGVLGMKWGKRKSPEQEAHISRAKGLKADIRKADLANFDRASKMISKKEKELNAKLDSIQARKISEIDNSKSMGSVRKFLAKATVKMDISARRDNIVGQLEEKYHFNPDHKRVAEKKKAQIAIMKKYEDLYDQRFNEISAKKLPFLQDIKAAAAADRELSMKLTEELLRSELAIERRRFDD